MIYLKSTLHNVVVRIDPKEDKAYIKRNGKETELKNTSTTLTDACIENKRVSEKEY